MLSLTRWLFPSRKQQVALQRQNRRTARRMVVEPLERREVFSVDFGSVLAVGNETGATAGLEVAVDHAGNRYVTGVIYSATDFDPSVARPDGSDILTPRGHTDAYVAKYGPDNSLVWARRMGGDSAVAGDWSRSVAVDAAGNVYVAGAFANQADFGTMTLTSAGDTDAFVTKLDASGNFLWAVRSGSAHREQARDLALDATGNVFTVGLNATTGTLDVRKFSPGGALAWSRTVAGMAQPYLSAATDSAGNVYVAGSFDGTVDFDPSSKKKSISVVSESAFVLKLTTAGGFGWVSTFNAKNTSSAAYAKDLVVDGSGAVIVAGRYEGQVDLNPHARENYQLPNSSFGYDGFLTKLNSSGAFVWARQIVHGTVDRLAVDTTGAVYAVGGFHQTYAPSPNSPAVISAGAGDVFVHKYSGAGNLAWAVQFGGTGYDFGYGIAVGTTGKVSLTGSFDETVDFDPDPTQEHVLGSENTPWQLYLLEFWQD